MAGRFGSLVTAMVTPFRGRSRAGPGRRAALASHLLDTAATRSSSRGPRASRPRSPTRRRPSCSARSAKSRKGRGKLICGTGTYSTAETLELTQAAEDAGADGLLVVTPYYNKPPQRGLIAHFERVADATDLPIIVYNIPGRTATRIEHDTLLQLAERPTSWR